MDCDKGHKNNFIILFIQSKYLPCADFITLHTSCSLTHNDYSITLIMNSLVLIDIGTNQRQNNYLKSLLYLSHLANLQFFFLFSINYN
jgi:hypothetical protein